MGVGLKRVYEPAASSDGHRVLIDLEGGKTPSNTKPAGLVVPFARDRALAVGLRLAGQPVAHTVLPVVADTPAARLVRRLGASVALSHAPLR